MLNLIQSNRMAKLAAVFCERNSAAADPFEPMTVVVQSFGLGQWLKLQLADRHGIACNVDCVLPAAFLWRLHQQLIPEAGRLTDSPFGRARLIWRIMKLLQAGPRLSDAVSNFLDGPGDTDLRYYQLAGRLALLFDEYLMYRPELVLGWSERNREASGHEAWQAELWRLLLEDIGEHRELHRAALHRRLLAALAEQQTPPPGRLSIFGLSTLPPMQLETFEALAQSTEVDIYFMNPCEHYWGDVVSPKDKARRSVRSLMSGPGESLSDDDYLEVGNPLLSSLGRQGREFFELLLEPDSLQNNDEYFEAHPETSALNRVKNDILNLTFGGEFGAGVTPGKWPLADASIQLHACHSRMREVEVLHDEILRAMREQPALRLNDIIVMAPDIVAYAPFVHSVFADGELGNYRIADKTRLDNSRLLASFLTLLELPRLRLTGSEVMDLLETPAIMRRFGLVREDLKTLTHWIDTAEIRWELSGEDKQARWQLPGENRNTWRFGLDRLLLGFAMSPLEGVWRGRNAGEGLLPCEITPAEAELLGSLCHFLHLLETYRRKLDERHTPDAWLALVSKLIADFYRPRDEETLDVNHLLEITENLTTQARLGGYGQPVSRQVMAHAIGQALSATPARAGFITGGITFATLVPMRSIPFRMVCLLGMNDGEYPRDKRPLSFDLIAADPARCDRSGKQDDRYLFLEALLSAREVFYVSYIGRGVRDNKQKPPSILVVEWLHYLEDVFGRAPVKEHSLQPFNPRYYKGDDCQSFSRAWHRALSNPEPVRGFADEPLPEADSACEEVSDLAAFMRHPAQFFMQRRLDVYFDRDDQTLKDTETFQPDNLERFTYADRALERLVRGEDLEHYRDELLHSGALLAGPIGRQHLKREFDLAGDIHKVVEQHTAASAQTITAIVTIAGTTLELRLDNVYDQALVWHRAGQLRARQLLEYWVKHLAANAAGHEFSTFCIAKDSVNRLDALAPADAAEHLRQLLALFHDAMTQPLLLPPEASRTLAQAILEPDDKKRKSRENAIEDVRREWSSDWNRDRPGAECRDPYWSRLFDLPGAFDDSFAGNAQAVWRPLLEHLCVQNARGDWKPLLEVRRHE